MTKNLKKTVPFCFLGILVLFSSCGKKWKKPTDVAYLFQMNSNVSSSYVRINSGTIVLEELDFDGTRKQGENEISFDKKFENGQTITFTSSPSNSGISFDIPQGTYTEIRIRLKIKDFNSNNSLTLSGYYINTVNDTLPVLFDFAKSETIEIKAASANGSPEIVLMEDKPSGATVVLHPHYWFSTVTQNMLENADTTIINGIPSILVNENDNEDIYDLIIGRIRDGSEVLFN
jgi:hypothetical protein